MKTRVCFVSLADLQAQPAIEANRLCAVVEAVERLGFRTSLEWHRTDSAKAFGIILSAEVPE